MAQLGGIGVIPCFNLGGYLVTNLTNLIILHGYTNTNSRSSLRKSGAAAGYTVTALKTLTIFGLRIQAASGASATANSNLAQLVQADNDVGADSATAFTNPIYQGGAATNYTASNANISDSHPNDLAGWSFGISAGKVPSIQCNTGGAIYTAWGTEA